MPVYVCVTSPLVNRSEKKHIDMLKNTLYNPVKFYRVFFLRGKKQLTSDTQGKTFSQAAKFWGLALNHAGAPIEKFLRIAKSKRKSSQNRSKY